MAGRPYRFECFLSPANRQWYWRLRAPNGRIVAIGGEGYVRRSGAVNAARKVFADSPALMTAIGVGEKLGV